MRTEQILTRFTAAEKARVEELQRRLQAERPGVIITLSDVVRHAVHVASTVSDQPAEIGREPASRKRRKAKAEAAA